MLRRATPLLLCALLALPAAAQPVVDGDAADAAYGPALATWTQGDTGFGDYGIRDLYAYRTETTLYVMVTGAIETNFNEFYLFLDVASEDGVDAGTRLPTGSDGDSPFASFAPVNDMETDFGFRMTSGGGEAYPSIIDYRDGGNTDTYLGTIANDGTPSVFVGGPYAGTVAAYDHTAGLSNVATQGVEIALPLSVIGAEAGDTFRLFALYGNDAYISKNTLPEVPGVTNNLENNPDFTALAGTQATDAATLPVELTAFTARADGPRVQLAWTTASETGNAGFGVEMDGGDGFAELAFVPGAGTAAAPRAYAYTTAALDAGTYRFRLRQVDLDGTTRYAPAVEVTVGLAGAFALSAPAPNPTTASAAVSLTVGRTQHVQVGAYDLLGRRVATVYDGTLEADRPVRLVVDGGALPAGVYVLHARGEGFSATRPFTVLR